MINNVLLRQSKFQVVLKKSMSAWTGGEIRGNKSVISCRSCCTCTGNKITADLAIIGVGPGGLFSALRAKENGIDRVVVIDKLPSVGGTCINYGCIPTKCLLNFSKSYNSVKSGLYASQGVITSGLKLDLDVMNKKKLEVMKGLAEFMEGVFRDLCITIIRGTAEFTGCNQISVKGNDGKKYVVEACNILIASGSKIRQFPGIEADEKSIITSNGAIIMGTVPKKFTVLGAGIIGIELGSHWSRLGSEVTVITDGNFIGSASIDKDVRQKYKEILEKQGLTFLMQTKVLCATKSGNIVKYETEDRCGNRRKMECDVLMISIGRVPNTDCLNLERVGIKTNQYGAIIVDHKYQTSTENIYAIGDVTPGPMVAHKALEEGMLCVDGLCGSPTYMDWNNIPLCIYTHPELASVGKTEEQLKAERHCYKVKYVSLKACARARTDLDLTGIIKTLICTNTDRILGTHMICAHAGELINEAVVAQQYGVTALEVSKVVHSHPTYAKMFKQAFGH